MSEAQDSATQKLQRGHKILTSGPGEADVLSLAFIRMHGALEDRLRELLANQLPRQRLDIFDVKEFTWAKILEFSQAHLGMSEADAEFIAQANACRNLVAHGGDFPWTRERVFQYEQLITQLWAAGSRTGAPLRTPGSAPRTSQPAARLGPFPIFTPRPGASRPGGAFSPFRPALHTLFRSKRFFYILISALLAVIFLVTAGSLLWNHLDLVRYFSNATPTATPNQSTRAPLLPPTAEATPSPRPTATPTAAQATPEAQDTLPASGCEVVWMEYPGEELDKMNRAMVWTEVVSVQVSGSGMAPTEFYRLVAEQNPFLVTDGYVFLKDKTYLLPRCR